MSYKVACGQCGGYLYADKPGQLLRCPHCGTPLEIPAPDGPDESEGGGAPDREASPGDKRTADGTVSPPAGVRETVVDDVAADFAEPAATAAEPTAEPSPPVPAEPPIAGATGTSEPGWNVVDFPRAETQPQERSAEAAIGEPNRSEASGTAAPPADRSDLQSTLADDTPETVAQEAASPSSPPFLSTPPEGTGSVRPRPIPPSWDDTPADTDSPWRQHQPSETPHPPSAVSGSVSEPTWPGTLADSGTPSALSNDHSAKGVSRRAFLLLATYASAVTIGLLYLLWMQLTGAQRVDPRNLESLPDVIPPTHNGQVPFQLVPEHAPLPPGHTLRLGESRRFGNVRVTPLRVVWAPVRFVYYRKDQPSDAADGFSPPSRPRRRRGTHPPSRPPTPPTLCLWLRFENVSRDQRFVPLGHTLAWRRILLKGGRERSNQFVCRAENKATGPYVLLMDFRANDIWELEGNAIGRALDPGQTCELYLPADPENVHILFTDAGRDSERRPEPAPPFVGSFLWRVHFRKGYNPQSKRGVTTVIEVAFEGSQISSG